MPLTVRVHPLLTGEIRVPPGLLVRRGGPFNDAHALGFTTRKRIWVPVPAFLVEHPTEGPILIDSGMSSGIGPVGRMLYTVRGVRSPPDLLLERGIDPASVETVLMTHLHLDHAGGLPDLPGATVAAEALEWAAADSRKAITAGYHRPMYAHSRRRSLDVAGGEPWEGFDHTLDLFGDGSVRAVWTPGHTPGHLSFALAVEGRHVLVVADLAYTAALGPPGLAADMKAVTRSHEQLRAFVARHPEAVLIPGHDPETWPALDSVYA